MRVEDATTPSSAARAPSAMRVELPMVPVVPTTWVTDVEAGRSDTRTTLLAIRCSENQVGLTSTAVPGSPSALVARNAKR